MNGLFVTGSKTFDLRKIIRMFPIWSVILLNACTANRYLAPVTSFQTRTQQTVGVLSDFYSSRNSYEIDLYLLGVAADSSIAVQTTDAQGKPTPLGKPVFSPASLKARLDALSLVGVYATRLHDLAASSAPTDFQTASTALGTGLSSLDKTFQTLTGTSDPTAGKYTGPISSLIGAIGQMYLQQKRDQMIAQAVKQGGPLVDTILSQVSDDMNNVFSLQVVTGAAERLADLVVAYNRDRGSLTYEQRTGRLAEIKAAATEAASAVGSAPANLVTAMKNANDELLKAVISPKKTPLTLASLTSSFEQWSTQIQTLSSQVKNLIH